MVKLVAEESMTDVASPRVYRGTLMYEGRLLLPMIGFLALLPFTRTLEISGHLTGWGYMAALSVLICVLSVAVFVFRRPTLSIDPTGVRLRMLQYSWRYKWSDILGIGEFQRERAPVGPSLGLLLRADVKPQHPVGEAAGLAMYGYQALIPDMWDAPLSSVKEQLLAFHREGQQKVAHGGLSPVQLVGTSELGCLPEASKFGRKHQDQLDTE
jgi:hypothetical protein